jgi:hypothetical protein
MKDEDQIRETSSRPVVVHPGPRSIEDILKYVDPAPEDETDRFVAAIYADRRESAAAPHE